MTKKLVLMQYAHNSPGDPVKRYTPLLEGGWDLREPAWASLEQCSQTGVHQNHLDVKTQISGSTPEFQISKLRWGPRTWHH